MKSRNAALELTLLAVLVMAVLLGILTWLSLRWQRAWLLEEVDRGLSLTGDTLQSSLRRGMMENRRHEIQDSIERVARDTRIERVRIFEHRGRIGMSTNQSDHGLRVGKTSPACAICHTRSGAEVSTSDVRTAPAAGSMQVFSPIKAERGCITSTCHQRESETGVLGVIDVSLSLKDVEQALGRSQTILLLASLMTVLSGGLLFWLALARRFRRPMRELLGGIRRVATGDLKHRIPARVHDEFGELAESFNDMSGRLNQMRKSLIQSERLISMGKLAAGVAHEINNPLSGILAYAEDLAEGAGPDDPRREDYQVIVHEAMRCRKIVRNLLDFSRQGIPTISSIHPGELIEKAVNTVARQKEFAAVRFERRVAPDLRSIAVDPIQIQQVLVNLIINAQQAMPQGGTIVLGARMFDGGRKVEFTVEDQGVGMPDEIRPFIFEPFFSTKEGRTDGLGLAACLGIVQQHNGSIDFESEPGQGTTFRVVLPAAGSGEQPIGEVNAVG